MLQHCHRIHQREGSDLTEEDVAYNDRGQRFLHIMNRLRDCTWTEEDYYWLCKRKMNQLPLAERTNFVDAPVIMEFRKERDESDPHDSCESYNRRHLYPLAKEAGVPVARIVSFHEGVPEDDAAKMSEELFSGLIYVLELCEGAPIIYTHNLWVAAGLMNGTRGTIRAIVYRRGGRPDHDVPSKRLPGVILAECPDYCGDSFFDTDQYPERSKWVPFFPRTLGLEDDNTVTRTQYALVLAWALTPWKAQGMSLKKVEVKIGSAASRPGVVFTTLTRCTHPDGLVINDDFPVMFIFQKQKKT